MLEIEESLMKLLQTNTLLGGKLPEAIGLNEQLDQLTQWCYPYKSKEAQDQICFSSPIWDNLDRYKIYREVFGIEAFGSRTQLLLSALGHDPYSFDTVKKFAPIGMPVFPTNKSVYVPKDFYDVREAYSVLKSYSNKEDTSIVVRLEGLGLVPHFSIQSVFNPYFTYLRQLKEGHVISVDLLCAQARGAANFQLEHKSVNTMKDRIEAGFSPQVGINILPMKDGISLATVTTLPNGFPYPEKDLVVEEKKPASPDTFEL